MRGERIVLIDEAIQQCFDLPCPPQGILLEFYRVGEEKMMIKETLRPVDAHKETNLKKTMLKRKYRLLLDIIQTIIVGITFSKDGLSTEKIRILSAMIDRSKQIN